MPTFTCYILLTMGFKVLTMWILPSQQFGIKIKKDPIIFGLPFTDLILLSMNIPIR